jgi:hypothetical protein
MSPFSLHRSDARAAPPAPSEAPSAPAARAVRRSLAGAGRTTIVPADGSFTRDPLVASDRSPPMDLAATFQARGARSGVGRLPPRSWQAKASPTVA